MKFLAIMGHEETRLKVRALFKEHQVKMFSSFDIMGCNCDNQNAEQQSWWPTDAMPADAIMQELEKKPIAVDNDFPARAFLMNVEKMA